MIRKTQSGLIPIIPGILLAVLFTGCVYDPYYAGPPPHSHFRPYYYDYYYYPGVRVYFQFTTGFYFYYDGRIWVRTKILPPHIHIDPHDRVRIRVDSDRPYLKHHEHREKYKPRYEYPAYKKPVPEEKAPRDYRAYPKAPEVRVPPERAPKERSTQEYNLKKRKEEQRELRERDHREREANTRWYKEYRDRKEKDDKQERSEKKDRKEKKDRER